MFPAALGPLLFYFLYELLCLFLCRAPHPSALYIGVQSQGKEPGDHREAKVKPQLTLWQTPRELQRNCHSGKNSRQARPLSSLKVHSVQSSPGHPLASPSTCPYKNTSGPTPCHPGYILSAWLFREEFRLTLDLKSCPRQAYLGVWVGSIRQTWS